MEVNDRGNVVDVGNKLEHSNQYRLFVFFFELSDTARNELAHFGAMKKKIKLNQKKQSKLNSNA